MGPSASARAISLKPWGTRRAGAVTLSSSPPPPRVLADLAGGHADGSFEARLRRWARPHILVLDDFGIRPFTATQADDLYELVTERRASSLILASNRAPADWYGLFPAPVIAEGVLDRVVNSAHHIPMEGKSYRPNRRPGRPGPARRGSTNP
jgi:DNA replication protein DnaC